MRKSFFLASFLLFLFLPSFSYATSWTHQDITFWGYVKKSALQVKVVDKSTGTFAIEPFAFNNADVTFHAYRVPEYITANLDIDNAIPRLMFRSGETFKQGSGYLLNTVDPFVGQMKSGFSLPIRVTLFMIWTARVFPVPETSLLAWIAHVI